MIPHPTMDDIIRHLNNRDYVTVKALIVDMYYRNGSGTITDMLLDRIVIPLLENRYPVSAPSHTVTVTVRLIEDVPPEEPKPVSVKEPNVKTKKEKARQETMNFPVAKDPKKGKHSNMIGARLCLNEEKQKEFIIDWWIHRYPLILLSGKYNITTQTVKNYIKRYRNGKILKGWKPSK